MKRQIFMYLFIFSALFILFQYVNSKRYFDRNNKKIEKLEAKITKYSDTINSLRDEVSELSYFNLDRNQDAIDYFYDRGINTDDLIPLIKDEIIKLNDYDTSEHPLVPYEAVTDGKILINGIRLLNHKWIVADFNNGKYWGEIFVKYEVTDDKQLKFKVIDSFWYPFR